MGERTPVKILDGTQTTSKVWTLIGNAAQVVLPGNTNRISVRVVLLTTDAIPAQLAYLYSLHLPSKHALAAFTYQKPDCTLHLDDIGALMGEELTLNNFSDTGATWCVIEIVRTTKAEK